ncbi:MAG: ABC transporter substrate-binding protein [Tepidisphaeraceae bacterium]
MGAKGSLILLTLVCVVLGILRMDHAPIPSASNKGRIELEFWNGFTGPDGRVMLELVRQFNEANPDVHVSMQRIAWGTYYNKVMVSAIGGRGPQVYVLQSWYMPRMERAGIIAPIDDLFDDAFFKDFDPRLMDRVRFGEHRLGVPLDVWPQGLYCNGDMMKQVGLTNPDGSPRGPANLDEFKRACAELKKDTDGNGTIDQWGFSLANWGYMFMALVPQFNGGYVDEQGNMTLNTPGNVAALQFMVDLLQKDHLIPSPEAGVAGWVGFRQKKVAMVIEGIYMVGDLKRLTDHPYFGAPIPKLGQKPGTWIDSHVLCIRNGVSPEERDAAARFIRFVSDHSLAWADAGQVPARTTVRESDGFKKLQVQYAFSQQLPYGMFCPKTPSMQELQNFLNLGIEKAIRGRMSAADALKEADENFKRYLERDRMERELATGGASESSPSHERHGVHVPDTVCVGLSRVRRAAVHRFARAGVLSI